MQTEGNKIYALFSIENGYNQPSNNLITFWHTKPSIEMVASALGMTFPAFDDENTLCIVKIWSGNSNVRLNNVDYRIDCISPGEVLY